jgi:hypothetical protein
MKSCCQQYITREKLCHAWKKVFYE